MSQVSTGSENCITAKLLAYFTENNQTFQHEKQLTQSPRRKRLLICSSLSFVLLLDSTDWTPIPISRFILRGTWGETRKSEHNNQNKHKSLINVRGGVGLNLQLGFSLTLQILSKAYSYSLGSTQTAFWKLLQGKAKRINAGTIAFKPSKKGGTRVQAQFKQMF